MFPFKSFATVYCPTVHMFPSIQHLSVRQSSTNGTGINLCQQTDRGTQAGRFVWPCAVTVRVSFLFVHKRTLAPCPILSQHFGDEDGFQSVLCVFLCARCRGQGRLRLTTELLHIPQQALLRPVPRKTAQDLGLERPYPAASEGYTRVCECVCVHV